MISQNWTHVHEDFDLSSVCTIIADRFRVRRRVFYAVGATTLTGILGVAIWVGVFIQSDPPYRAGIVILALLIAFYGGAYGFVYALQLAPGPSRLSVDDRGVTVGFTDGRSIMREWVGSGAHFWMDARSSHVEGVPDFDLVIQPRLMALFPPYRGVLPITPLTAEAFSGLLNAAKAHGAIVVTQPSSNFLGMEAPGTAHIFALPSRRADRGPV